MKKILFVFVFSLLIASCEEKPHTIIDYLTPYAFINNSGVKVAVVTMRNESRIPDSLVLENKGTYNWGVDGVEPIYASGKGSLRIYFDEIYVVNYEEDFNPEIRDPRLYFYYESVGLPNGRYMGVYIFTVEDYERAVEQNNVKK